MNWLSLVIRRRPPMTMLCRLAPKVRGRVEEVRFFFTVYRSKTHGPHLRLRLLVSAGERALLLRMIRQRGPRKAAAPRRLRRWWLALEALRQNGAEVLPSRYLREYRRYGGREGVAGAEAFFAGTSRLCFVHVYGPGAEEMTTLKLQCFRAALRCCLQHRGACFRAHLRSFVQTARLADGTEFVLAVSDRRRIRAVLEDPQRVDSATRAAVLRWSRALRLVVVETAAGGAANRSDYWHSLLHMTANKLGIDPLLERVLLAALV